MAEIKVSEIVFRGDIKFAKYRLNGEWFKWTDELKEMCNDN